jgi:hypothetical protein
VPWAGGLLTSQLVLLSVQLVPLVGQALGFVSPVLDLVGSFFRLGGVFFGLVGAEAGVLGGPLQLVGAFPRQPLLTFIRPFLGQIGSLVCQLGSLLGPGRGFLCLVGPLAGPVRLFAGLLSSLPQLTNLVLPVDGSPDHVKIRSGDTRLLRLAEILLLRRLAEAGIGCPALGGLPGHAVRLAGFRHAPTSGGLLGLVPGHDRLSRRVCPRLPA